MKSATFGGLFRGRLGLCALGLGLAIAPASTGLIAADPGQETTPAHATVSERHREKARKETERAQEKLRKGDAEAARQHYRAALELDPGNEAARAGLDRLGPEPETEAVLRSGASDGVLGVVEGAPAGPINPDAALYHLAKPYLRHVESACERHGVDERLVLGVIMVESGFNPSARSTSGARGLMQLLPETAHRFGARSVEDPAENVEAGIRYLRFLLETFGGDVDRALAGYNAGEMAVVQAGGVPARPSVQRFVSDVKARSRQF